MAKVQLEFFAEDEAARGPAATPVGQPDPDRIRRRLARILAEARAAETMPWDDNEQRLYATIVPRMSQALPEAEAAEIVTDFQNQMARLMAA